MELTACKTRQLKCISSKIQENTYYNRRPETVQAIQYTQEMESEFICLGNNHDDKAIPVELPLFPEANFRWKTHSHELELITDDGPRLVSVNDFIIWSEDNQFYPCGSKFFELSFENATEERNSDLSYADVVSLIQSNEIKGFDLLRSIVDQIGQKEEYFVDLKEESDQCALEICSKQKSLLDIQKHLNWTFPLNYVDNNHLIEIDKNGMVKRTKLLLIK